MNSLYRIVRYPGIYISISTLLVLVMMSMVAWLANRYIEADREIPLIKALGTYIATIEGGTVNSRAMGAAILFGLENREAKKLALEKLPPDLSKGWSALDTMRTVYLANAVFLVNKQGAIAAYSGKDGARGIESDVSSRSYVQLAMQGTPNVYPAVNGDNKDRGIYLAAPLRAEMNNASASIGAIVIKIGAEKLDELLKSWTGGTALLLSPQGVVFAASREDWLFHMTGKVSSNRVADIRRTGQYGTLFDHAPPLSLPFTLNKSESYVDGVNYAVRSLPLEWNDPEGDWMLVFLEQRNPWWTQWIVMGSASLAGLITALTLFWFYILVHFKDEIQTSEERYRLLLRYSPVGIFHYDTDLIITYCNDRFAEILKSKVDSLIGLDMKTLLDQSVLPSLRNALNGKISIYEGQYLSTLSAIKLWISMTSSPSRDNSENVVGGIAVVQDITDRKRSEAEMRIAAISFESQEGLLITDANNSILRVNRAFTFITGYAAEEVIGKSPRMLRSGRHDADFYAAMWDTLKKKGNWEGEIWNRRKNGEIYPGHLSITAVRDAHDIVSNYVAAISDITLRKQAEERIQHLAFYDSLTELPNRRLLLDRLQQAVVSCGRSGKQGALLFIDLDNFKTLNDTLGHDIGDTLLQQVAHRLTSCVREGDTVARLGGDEFVVMLEKLSEHTLDAASLTESIGNKILATLNQPYQLAKHEYHNTPSIGATLFNDSKQTIDELMKQVDIAMYESKKAGRNTLRFFDIEMQEVIKARSALEGELRKALENHQFQLYYQIQVDGSHHHRPFGAEVLIRWMHPERGLVPPAEFIPLAEESGLIMRIGEWVLETACSQLVKWSTRPETEHLSVSVNVSASQFHQVDFADRVLEVIERTGANPQRLKLEITESTLLSDIDSVIIKMDILKTIGVGFSLDDFGTGYSSLYYLSRLPLEQIKIDRSFVMNLESKDDSVAICAAIIGLAHNLKLKVVAEGVETEAQHYILSSVHHCDYFQGYLFGKPVPIEQFEYSLEKS